MYASCEFQEDVFPFFSYLFCCREKKEKNIFSHQHFYCWCFKNCDILFLEFFSYGNFSILLQTSGYFQYVEKVNKTKIHSKQNTASVLPCKRDWTGRLKRLRYSLTSRTDNLGPVSYCFQINKTPALIPGKVNGKCSDLFLSFFFFLGNIIWLYSFKISCPGIGIEK